MIKIAVRLDDITKDMDWPKFLAFKSILDQHNIKPLIGVVPFNMDTNLQGSEEGRPSDYWEYIKKLKEDGWEIALHGYNHVYTTSKGGCFPLNNFSEYAGVEYDKQLKMLIDGKKELSDHGIETNIFMAPGHSFDKITLKALKEAGFNALTDGFGKNPYIRGGLVFYPISFLWKKTMEMKDGYSTLVVHTATINDISVYEKYFNNPNIEWINYSDYLSVTAQNRNILGVIKEYIMAAGKGMIGRIR